MIIFIFYIAFVILVGMLADKYNRSVRGYIILAILLSPLIAGLALLIQGKKIQDGHTVYQVLAPDDFKDYEIKGGGLILTNGYVNIGNKIKASEQILNSNNGRYFREIRDKGFELLGYCYDNNNFEKVANLRKEYPKYSSYI